MNLNVTSMGSFPDAGTSEPSSQHSTPRLIVAVAMVVWLAAVLVLGAKGAFLRAPGEPPLPILVGATSPLLLFFAVYFGSSAFRGYILGADLRVATTIQAWRAGGLTFLDLYAHHLLPGIFAWPAGLGDIAIGMTAPWILLNLIRQPGFAARSRYVTWNILGILDLLVAVSMGALSSTVLQGFTGGVTMAPMTQIPLVLIPAYFVPFFIMLHFTALAQARQQRREAIASRSAGS